MATEQEGKLYLQVHVRPPPFSPALKADAASNSTSALSPQNMLGHDIGMYLNV